MRAMPMAHAQVSYFRSVSTASLASRGVGIVAQEASYLPSDPTHSCLGLARGALGNELATFAIGAPIFPPFVFFAVRRWRRGRRGRCIESVRHMMRPQGKMGYEADSHQTHRHPSLPASRCAARCQRTAGAASRPDSRRLDAAAFGTTGGVPDLPRNVASARLPGRLESANTVAI